MKRTTLWLLLGILAVAVIFLLVTYNSLVGKEEDVKRYWGDLQTTYQRRNDLVPNLVAVVKSNSDYERTVLTQVAEARSKAGQLSVTSDPDSAQYNRLERTQGELTNSMNRLIAVVENYPDLQGTKAFTMLQTQLEGTERRINLARKDFNTTIADYNNSVRRFPTNLAAGILGFRVKEGFNADSAANAAPQITFKKQ